MGERAGKPRILIVEDEQIVALHLKDMLKSFGYEILDLVNSGREAVHAALEYEPDLVLMDIVLDEEMSGIEAAREIRRKAIIPIIYITANADRDTVEKARDTEPYGYLNKPINIQDLYSNIDSALHRFKLEMRLRESREKYQDLVGSIGEVLFSLDENGVFTFLGPQVEALLGYRADELIGEQASMIFFEEDLPLLAKSFQRRKQGISGESEYRLVTRDGKVLWGRASSRPVMVDGRFEGVKGVVHDITEKKAAEMALQESEEKYRSLVEAAIDGICIIQEGTINFANSQLAGLLGYTVSEMLGDGFEQYIHPDELENIKQICRAINSGELEPQKMETALIDASGTRLFVEFSFNNTTYRGKNSLQVIVSDISERKKAEQLMIQTEKMVTVGGLAAGMAHEINNPLGVILQGVQVIENRLTPDLDRNRMAARKIGIDIQSIREYLKKREVLDYLEGIRHAGSRAAKIVTNMLQFSRKSRQGKEETDINMLIDNTISIANNDYDLKKKYDFRKIKIMRNYNEDIPQVMCISSEIEQVIFNLLKNSAQAFMEQGRKNRYPRIDIETGVERKYVVITISDNGPGIEKEMLNKIFDPFFSTKETGIGTGLGLSVSYFIIVNNHKGVITAESEVGKGSTFTVKLPAG